MTPIYVAQEFQDDVPIASTSTLLTTAAVRSADLDELEDEEEEEEEEAYDDEQDPNYYYDEYTDQYYPYEHEQEEEEEEDSSVVVRKETKPISDVADSVYFDETSLTRCWTSALNDYKYLHPIGFLPSTEAPRSLKAKHQAAPLWYGSLPLPKNGTHSSSSIDPDRAESILSNSTNTTTTATTTNQSSNKISRKTLKNQRKRARKEKSKQVKNSQFEEAEERVLKKTRFVNNDEEEEEEEEEEDDGPSWTPQSPQFQRSEESIEPFPLQQRSISLDSEPDSSKNLKDETRIELPKTTTTKNDFLPRLSSNPNSTFLLPQRRDYPLPPAIVPLDSEMIESTRNERAERRKNRSSSNGEGEGTGTKEHIGVNRTEKDVEDEEESTEGLLQSALWAWYTAGYQTALYHAAIGVAGVNE